MVSLPNIAPFPNIPNPTYGCHEGPDSDLGEYPLQRLFVLKLAGAELLRPFEKLSLVCKPQRRLACIETY